MLRWRHPFLDKIKKWLITILKKVKILENKPNVKEQVETETFIQGLVRINSQANVKEKSSNIQQLVPFKMYKAKDLLVELQKQREQLNNN